MNRFSPSREPAAWIGLLSAVAALLVILGVHLPDGTEAAAAAVITAGSAAFIRSKVSPAKQTVRIDTAPTVHVTTVDGDKETRRTYLDGKFASGSSVIAHKFPYGDPAEVQAKSAADLKADHERARADLGIVPAKKPAKKATKKKAGR